MATTTAPVSWSLKPGDLIRRVVLHDQYGGERQSGVSPSGRTPNVMIFSDPKSGEQHGYFDRWEGDVFLYTGKGKTGDQEMVGGNAAILNHENDGRALRVFSGTSDTVRYVGEFALDDPPYIDSHAPATDDGPIRRVIVFRLRPVERVRNLVASQPPEVAPYRRANHTPATKPSEPFERDPNEVDRGLAAHAETQNSLHDFLKKRHIVSWSPGRDEPDYDLAWSHRGTRFVAEVKSLPVTSESKQLRLGLGQVLDYADQLLEFHKAVQPVLAVERAPSDPRWLRLCERHGVILVWPETFVEVLR